MRKRVKNIAMSLCSMVMAIALVFGFVTFGRSVKAEGSTLSMINGASLRIDAEDPSLIFAATLQEVDADATYGMLVVEHSLLVDNAITEDYLAKLDELGLAYEKIICKPIETEDAYKIKAYFEVETENFNVEYAAVAFVEKAGAYTYTELTDANVRSVAYVAKQALANESFSALNQAALSSWADNAKGEFDGDNTVAAIDVDMFNVPGEKNGADIVSFITSTYFAGGSVVEFDIFVPTALVEHFENIGKPFSQCWISVCWTDDLAATDLYAHAYGNGVDVSKQITPGKWSHVSVTIPGESNMYVYIGAAKGEWGGHSMLIDNFSVTEDGVAYVEDFEGELEYVEFHGNPNAKDGNEEPSPIAAEEIIQLVNVPVVILDETVEPGEHALKYTFNVGMDEEIPFITTEAFAAGSTVEFMYYIPAGASTSWWIWAWTDDTSKTPYYAQLEGAGADLSTVTGEWTKVNVTLPAEGGPYYIYITSNVGGWELAEGGNAYVLIDNLTVNGELVEDFNNGLEDSKIAVVNAKCVELAQNAGYVGGDTPVEPDGPTFPGEYGAELYIDSMTNKDGGDVGNFVTRNSYEAGTKISFMYYIPADVTPSWWWVGLASDPYSIPSQYEGQIKGLSKEKVGEWVTVELTLENAGHIFIMGSISEWGGGYAVIDNFKVNGELVEDFNNGISAFIYNDDAVKLGAGCVADEPEGPEFPGEYAAKLYAVDNVGVIALASNVSFAGGSEVSFKFYIPTGTTTNWWWISYTTAAPDTGAYTDYYHAPHFELPQTIIGGWATHTVTLPTDAESYYIFFVTEEGHWASADGSTPYVLIDNVAIDGEIVEDFNNGFVSFDARTDKVTVGEGYVEEVFEPGEYSAKLDFTNSFGIDATSFITKEAIEGGSTVSLMYNIPEDTVIGDWWSVNWDTTNVSPNFWAVGNGPVEGCGGINPTGSNKDSGTGWVEFSFTLPAGGPYYVYIVGYQNWNGYVLIDNFKVNGVVVEDFNNGYSEDCAFANNETYVGLGEGYIAPSLPEDGAAKIAIDLISGTASTPSFITKEKYVSDGSLVVTFDYFMSGNLGNKWWAFFWTNDNTVASIYAHVEDNKENNNGIDLPVNVQDQWAKASVTIPAGEWYLYFGGSVGDWGKKDGEEGRGYVIIDNFKIGNLVTEDFNNTNNLEDASDYGIFVDNRSSKPNAITLVEGKPADEEPTPDPEPEFPGEYSAKLYAVDNVGVIAFASNVAFAGGSQVTFMFYIPAGTTTNWWWISYTTAAPDTGSYTDYYDAPHFDLPQNITGVWTTYTVTLPTDAESYYIFFVTEEGHWASADGSTPYVLIDNIKVNGELVEDFSNGFVAFDARTEKVTLGEGYEEETVEAGEYAAQIFIDKIKADAGLATFVTKEKYDAGTEISFMYYIPADVTCNWFAVLCLDTQEQVDVYTDWLWQGSLVKGAWIEFKATLTEDGYIAIAGAVGDWGAKDDPRTEGYILIDNFTVGDSCDDFSYGLTEGLFAINNNSAVALGEGYVYEAPQFPGDYAAKVTVGTLKGGQAGFVTKEAYPAGSVITLRTYVATGTAPNWWRLAYTTDPSNVSMYDDPHITLSTTLDQWRDRTLTLPAEGGPYYIFVAGPTGEAGFGLIDNVVITTPDGTVYFDDFSNGLDAKLFNVNDMASITLSANGEGIDEPAVEEPADPTPDPEMPQGEGYLVVDFKAFEEGRINLHTKQAYTNITEFYVDIYVPAAEAFDWYGFTPASAVSGKDAYFAACTSNVGLKTSMGYYGWYDQWVTVKYIVEDGVWKPYLIMRDGTTKHKDTWNADLSGADYVADGASYIILSANPARSYEWGMWIDNVRIVADGVTYEDTFSNGVSTLFDYSSAATVVYEA